MWCLNPVISNGLCEAHKEIEALHHGLSLQSAENSRLKGVLAELQSALGLDTVSTVPAPTCCDAPKMGTRAAVEYCTNCGTKTVDTRLPP